MEGQNKGCAYCYRGTWTIPNGLVGHLESIGVNLDVAQESSDGFSTTKFAGCDL